MRNRTSRGLRFAAALATVALAMALTTRVTSAQTSFMPYFGKNQIRYDHFQWLTYETEHFTIYYYPEIEPHLERMAGYAESAYQHISSELKHDLANKVSLILFQTSSEFQEQNVIPGAAQEGVGAFAEPTRQRIVMPMDEPPDLLYRLIVHELTHQFEFDMIPTSLIRRDMPLWINEGLSDYMTGFWRPLDLMMVRDAAVNDAVPRMSRLSDYGDSGNPRMIYNLGHSVFEFIESRWGKKGIQDYVLALRKSVIGGGEDAFLEAFNLTDEVFDQQFEKYLKERFKPFRDKERADDYGRNLAPDPERSSFSNVLTAEPSPSGDVIAVVTGNHKDQEADIVLTSSRNGSVISNLTAGFDQSKGFEFIITPGGRWNTVPWLSWSPSGDRLAYFVRSEKSRTLIIQNVLDGKIVQRHHMRTVDDPESPDFSPDGRKIAFAAQQGGVGDIFVLDLETKAITNVTQDGFGNSGPTWSPDGSYIIYLARISSNEKLFRVDLDTGTKTQVTFGTSHDETAAQFVDENTLVFSSTATDPLQPIEPEIARNGQIYNIWTLDLRTNQLRQYTDALGGNVTPIVLKDERSTPEIAFISYDKNGWELHALERREPIATVASSDFGSPGPVIDFQAPLSHVLVKENIKKKGALDKLFLDGRPPVNIGVSTGGDVLGGTSVTISDVLGDRQFNFFVVSESQYRTMSFSYTNLSRRLNWAVQAYSQTQFFYGQLANVFYDPALAPYVTRDDAESTSTVRGGSAFAIWPFNRYRRVELFGSALNYSQAINNGELDLLSENYQQDQFGQPVLQNGWAFPVGLTYVSETTIFREFGPLSGNTVRASYEYSPPVGSLSRQTLDIDLRKYIRLGSSGLLALRGRGFNSWGGQSDFIYFGGNSELRGYEYLEFAGTKSVFMNAELRFPLIEAMLTPVGVLGGIRGVLFAGIGGGAFNGMSTDPSREGEKFKAFSSRTEIHTPIIGSELVIDPETNRLVPTPVYGPPRVLDGFRLVDARASYGVGFETFIAGFPLHFDWAWRTMMNREWEDLRYAQYGGSHEFRKPQFAMWIGYDF